MNNYIKFYIEDNTPKAKIFKNGQSITIKNQKRLMKLIDICSKYGYKINNECIIKNNVLLIAHDYEKYIEEKKEKKKSINVVGDIKPNMKVSRKNPLIGKVIVGTTLALVIAGFSINNKQTKNNTTTINTTTEYTTEASTEDMEELLKNSEMIYTPVEETTEYKSSYDLQEGEDIVEKIETDSGTINIIGDQNINQAEEEINKKNDLSAMFTPIEFHFTCNDPKDPNAMANAQRYDDLFEKYGNDYGIDKLYAECSAAQETNGDHYGTINAPYAVGIMQIERTNLDKGEYLEAYNFTTGQTDRIELTTENAEDLETNIQMGMMMKQIALKNNNYNILVGTQEYNMGCGNMNTVLATCSELEGINESDLRNNIDNQEWLNYREFLGVGDPKYIEHNFRYLPDGYTIKIRRVDNGEYETLQVFNDTENIKEY